MRFVYSVARFVPHPANGEFVALALIVAAEPIGPVRVATFPGRHAGLGHLDAHQAALEAFPGLLDLGRARGRGLPASSWLAALAQRQLGAVQFTRPLPMTADTIEAAERGLVDGMFRRCRDCQGPP